MMINKTQVRSVKQASMTICRLYGTIHAMKNRNLRSINGRIENPPNTLLLRISKQLVIVNEVNGLISQIRGFCGGQRDG